MRIDGKIVCGEEEHGTEEEILQKGLMKEIPRSIIKLENNPPIDIELKSCILVANISFR